MKPDIKFSIIIPARNEENYIRKCLDSIQVAGKNYPGQLEIIVAINRCTDRTEEIARSYGAKIVPVDGKNLSVIRNTAAKTALGEILITIDADSWMRHNMLTEIDRLLSTGKYIGGGVQMRPDRWSLGLVSTLVLIILPCYLWLRISGGLFWSYRKDFHAIGGFNENRVLAEDIDFGMKLKNYGKKQKKKFKTIWKSYIVTSTRKYDKFGDWYWFTDRRFIREALKGKNQDIANHYIYDFDR